MLYALKLGPIETGEGDCFAYLGLTEEMAMPPEMAKRDVDGLRRLLKQGKGHELRCEPRLAKAGKKFGFSSSPMPDWVREGRGFLSYGISLGPYGEYIEDKRQIFPFLSAMAKFMEAEPWQWWGSSNGLTVFVMGSAGKKYEGCIMGAGGQEFGLALYENQGAIERIEAAVDAGDFKAAAKESCIIVTLNFEPEWAVEAVHSAYGTKGIPLPMKLAKGKPTSIDPASLATLSAALEAAALLTPKNLTATVEVPLEHGRIRVTVVAPFPTG